MQDQVSSALTLAAIIIALCIWLYGRSRIALMRRNLGQLEADLQEGVRLFADVPDGVAFKGRLAAIGQRLAELPTIGRSWEDYTQALVIRQDAEIVMARSPASRYFNADLPYGSAVNLRSHEATPGQLVGAGLLFTFLGLFLSLLIATSGMGGTIDQAKQSLVALLSASALKFVTSIAALATALWFTHVKNRLLTRVDQVTAEFCEELGRLTTGTSDEVIAFESLAQLKQQTLLLERGNQDLARTIANEINATLESSLKDAIEPVAASINDMAQRLGEINEVAMRYMVDRFTKELGGAAREHTAQMAALLDQVSRAVQGVPEAINEAAEEFAGAIDESLTKIETTFDRANMGLSGALKEAASGVVGSAESLREVTSELTTLSATLRLVEEATEQRLEAAEKASQMVSSALAKTASQIETTVGALPDIGKLADQVAEAAGAVTSAGQDVQVLVQHVSSTREAIMEQAGQLASTSASFATSVGELDKSLGKVFEQLQSGVDDLGTRTERVITGMDTNLGKAVDKLTDAVKVIGKKPRITPSREAAE